MILPASKRLEFDEVPLIDLAQHSDNNLQVLAGEIESACRDVGFFYVKGHSVDTDTITELHEEAKNYFARPLEEKCKAMINDQIRGYLPSGYRSYEGEERAGTSSQEGFWIGYEESSGSAHLLDGPNKWPDDSPELKTAMLGYLAQVEQLGQFLLRGFSLALGMPETGLLEFFAKPCSRLKLNHYPPQARQSDAEMFGVLTPYRFRRIYYFVAG